MKRPDQENKIVDDTKHRFISKTVFKTKNHEQLKDCSHDSKQIKIVSENHYERLPRTIDDWEGPNVEIPIHKGI